MEIIHENEYVYKMNDEIEPYSCNAPSEGIAFSWCREDHLHRKDTGIVGKIHVQRYLAEKPKRRYYNQSWLYRSSAEI